MTDAIYVQVTTDDLRQFDLSVTQPMGRKMWSWSFSERVGLNVIAGWKSSFPAKYRSREIALAEGMVALMRHAESSKRP